MSNQANKVRAALTSAPYLLNTIMKSQGFNRGMFFTIYNRLLPQRTSVEIEHGALNINHVKQYIIHADCIPFYSFDLYERSNITESKISIADYKDLIKMYDLLKILKTHSSEDTRGSIHIHVNISDWYKCTNLNATQKEIRCLGVANMQDSRNNEILDFINSFLDKCGKLFNYDVYSIPFDFENGHARSLRKPDGTYPWDLGSNKRTINFNSMWCQISDRATTHYLNFRPSINYRTEHRVPAPEGKFNWVNTRSCPNTIEYRMGECSFDYETILNYMIGCNKLTKELLNFIDYIGRKAYLIPDHVLK